MNKIFHSKFFAVVLVILLALSLAALFREITSTIKVKREISRLEAQAQQLQSKNKDLKQVIEYLNSSAYMEKSARENLNLQVAGEIAVALPNTANQLDQVFVSNVGQHDSRNADNWWNYFFGPKN